MASDKSMGEDRRGRMSYVEKSGATGSGESSRGEKRARVFILDDHPLICEGLARVIECQPDMAVCGQAHDARTALTMLDQARPEVLIVVGALQDAFCPPNAAKQSPLSRQT